MRRWDRHKTVRVGNHWLAAAEDVNDLTPAGIRTARGATPEEADAELERRMKL